MKEEEIMVRKGKLLRSILLVIVMSILFSFQTFAEELNWEDFYGDDTVCVLTPEGTVVSRDEKKIHRRNEVLSTAIAQITNEGKGKIGILLTTLAHVNVDKIRQEAFLDKYDPEAEDWVNVGSYNFVATKDEYPDGFSYLQSSITVKNQPAGYYYRVRGLHAVWLDGEMDGFSTRTNGVLITNP